ncbi:hypothetical protein FJ934_11570 [Mesorhizobium sp. B2-4-12]|uniref:hypothetical protein n=1 Tax=Mesorhizobium sp. B2-4-12 TaxID=2589937 RepID=UPI00112ECCC8|nr:hypothetical protein [Mesorhizobium sp. B2-4-12]TPK95552.1 hypothetical protein FJ934_11570 [Mesorhizobium sp. B2-4-12]
MNKYSVRGKLIELAAAELDGARTAYTEHLQASKPAEDQATVVDDQAQAWSQAELAEDLEKMLRAAEAKVAALNALDFGPKEFVEPGAIVTVNGRHFVIGVSMDHFTCEGIELIGLSPLAPFYQAIDGLEKSDTVEFGVHKVKIEEII